MYKVIALLRRKPGVTQEEFADYWKHVHAPLVRTTLPGLRKYVLNVAEPGRGGEPPAFLDLDTIVSIRAEEYIVPLQ